MSGTGAAKSDPRLSNATPANDVRVTYVGNAGFLIRVGDRKILIDPLPEDAKDALMNARPPFNDVNLILITHNHGDHFDPAMIRPFLKNSPGSRLISTAQVTGQLAEFGNRIITLAATKGKRDQTDVDGIRIQAIYLAHNPVRSGEIEDINFGYLVTVNNIHLFHTGDCAVSQVDMTEPLSPGKRIDFAFIGHFYFTEDPLRKKFVREWIDGIYAIPSHFKFSSFDTARLKQIKVLYPDAVLFEKELQRWDMPASARK
jgi:L-ascorbate metabolism protein UlaG (beta-lactamase superfamily)